VVIIEGTEREKFQESTIFWPLPRWKKLAFGFVVKALTLSCRMERDS
jgi:hypothetical protein